MLTKQLLIVNKKDVLLTTILLIVIFLMTSLQASAQTGSCKNFYTMSFRKGFKDGGYVQLNFDKGKLNYFHIATTDCRIGDSVYNAGIMYTTDENKAETYLKNLVTMFKYAEAKFVEWSKVAKENKVDEIYKEIKPDGLPLKLSFNVYYDKKTWTMPGQSDHLDFTFYVKNFIPHLAVLEAFNVETTIYIGDEGPFGVPKYYTKTKRVKEFGLDFVSVDEIKNFINCFDVNNAQQAILKKEQEDKNKSDLFK